MSMKFRSFVFFLSVLALLAFWFVPSAAQAAEHIPYSEVVSANIHSTLGEYTYRLLPGERYFKSIDNETAYRTFSNLPITYHYYAPEYHNNSCYICGSSDYSYSCYLDSSVDGYTYLFDCNRCNTHIKAATYKDNGEWFVTTTGVVGSPFIGKVSQVVDFSGNLVKQFLNFILDNWFVLVIVAIPIFGICLSLVLRLRKGA